MLRHRIGTVLCAALLLVAVGSRAESPLLIVSSDYLPYTSSAKNDSGVVLQLIAAAFAEMHREVKFEFYPWARCELMIKHGAAFGAAPYFKTAERQAEFDFSAPIIYSYNRFFSNKLKFPRGFTWRTLEDFRGYNMGAVNGYWYIPAFERAGLRLDYANSDLLNMKKLQLQRIDFIVVDEVVANQLLRDNFSPAEVASVAMLDKPESVATFHLMISRAYPNHAQLTEELNQGLAILRAKNAYLPVLQRYGLPSNFVPEEIK
jgi:polar amino acid transport system substrate-binding protein